MISKWIMREWEFKRVLNRFDSYPLNNMPNLKKLNISIIVPTYNEEKLIAGTLRQIRDVAGNTELIVSDGHSKDNTVRIAKKYADKVIFEKGKTIASGRNLGAEEAKGDILLFVDADTHLNREFWQGMLHSFKDPRVVCVGSSVMPKNIGVLEKIYFGMLNAIVFLSVALGRPSIAGSCVAYRKQAFWNERGFDEERAASEDMDLSARIAYQGKVVFLKNVTVYTSRRRLKQLGLVGITKDWGSTTLRYVLGIKTKQYALFHEAAK